MASLQKDAQIKIIMSQTNYDKETAIEKIKEWKNDLQLLKNFSILFQEKEKNTKRKIKLYHLTNLL